MLAGLSAGKILVDISTVSPAVSRTLAKRVTLGSVIRIRPGERVPLDGIIVHGASSLDRSILTGETALKTLEPGDTVEAGGLNGDGELLVKETSGGRR